MRHLVVGIIDQRVVGLVIDRSVDAALLLTGDTVEADTIVYHLIVFPYSLLQGVHLRGVVFRGFDFIAQGVNVYGVAHRLGGVRFLLFSLGIRHARVGHHHRRDGGKQQNDYG